MTRDPTHPSSRAVPSAATLRAVRGLELRARGFVDSLFTGEHPSSFLGRGLEFSHIRRYQFGDDVRAIDWKVTARRGQPFVRRFVEERDLTVALVVDVSGSGRFGPGRWSAGEVGQEIAAGLACAAVRNNDRTALVLVSDRVEHFVPPGSGRKHTVRLLADLVSHRPASRATDLTSGLDHVSRFLPSRASVFVISDLIQAHHPAGAFQEALRRAAHAHDLVAVRLSSPSTDELPAVGWVEMTDPESGRRAVVNTGSRRVRARYRSAVRRTRANTAALLGEAGVDLVDVDTAADPFPVLTDFFRRRRSRR